MNYFAIINFGFHPGACDHKKVSAIVSTRSKFVLNLTLQPTVYNPVEWTKAIIHMASPVIRNVMPRMLEDEIKKEKNCPEYTQPLTLLFS